MTRRALFWWSVAVVAAIVLGAAWFFSEFTRVPTTRWVGAGAEARKNPYLALERFFERMGLSVHAVTDARTLGELPRGGVLILDRGRRRHVPAERADELLSWVAGGGRLIVAAEYAGTDDPILRRLGVSWCKAKHQESATDVEPAAKEPPAKRSPQPETVSVPMPGRAPMALARFPLGLCAGALAPSWRAELEPGRAQVLDYTWGSGHIAVFNDLTPFTNTNIGQHDHAGIVWALASRDRQEGAVWLASRLRVPSLWEWLAESAWMALASGAALIGLWLWRIVPRFGGLRQLPVPERRGLGDHLTAMGRGVWRAGGLSDWLAVVRHALLARIAWRHPHVLNLPPDERSRALARLSGMSASRVRLALEGEGTRSSRAFTETVRAIQQLHHRL